MDDSSYLNSIDKTNSKQLEVLAAIRGQLDKIKSILIFIAMAMCFIIYELNKM
jgi:hypothetical protein